MLYEISNIQWELDAPEDNPNMTYEEMLTHYKLPTHYMIEADSEDDIADALSDKFHWLVQSYDATEMPSYAVEASYSESARASLTDIANAVGVKQSEIESVYFKWDDVYVYLKNGDSFECSQDDIDVERCEADYKRPEQMFLLNNDTCQILNTSEYWCILPIKDAHELEGQVEQLENSLRTFSQSAFGSQHPEEIQKLQSVLDSLKVYMKEEK